MSISNIAIDFYNDGCDLLALGKYREARLKFEHAIHLNGDFADALVNIGICYSKENKFQQSILYYIRAINIDSENYIAHINYAKDLYCLSLYKEATLEFERCLSLYPSKCEVYWNLAESYATTGRNYEALKMIFSSIKMCPSNLNIYKSLVFVLILAVLNPFTRKRI